MGAVERPECLPTTEDAVWIRVEEASSVGAVRRAATGLAQRLGFGGTRVAEVGIVATELGTNLQRHAREGMVVLRVARTDTEASLEVLAVDRGPGIADVSRTMRDGHSTGGTLGIGLGAITRLADWSAVHSEVGAGTVVVARFHPARTPGTAQYATGITRAIGSETVCGDAYAIRREDQRLVLMVCDGAGHGPLAATASRRAVRVFCEGPWSSPTVAVERIHRELMGTRGGAVGVAELNPATQTVRYAGIGNIAGSVVTPASRRGMVCLPGIAGHRARSVRGFDYPLPHGGVVVLHSDGLTDRWQLDPGSGVLSADPVVIAAVLLRDAGVRQDDASVVVARLPAP
ncbi:ATP-binding protein [Kibdelosporangium phytohabitans]|uniref:Transcriptional regulator n=1 Tax=Kibdelosporangium phytohabitans TaxID=860235 RepID=A0A0N9I105_9PSEU|nr:ATP-binding protein [Kibdelosporangium phytohabitans]ALG08350.1 transcriptional regulator [Kibdelosporangium phytohabitans]MBE1470611.1 anti-sigma regulatory factor (Ser/Thr protein kinase) [Kibdelosporangium phytohabitans]